MIAVVRLSGGHPTELAHQVHHRQIRRGTAVGQTVSLHIPHLSPHQTAAEFRQQPRLAHAGLAHDRDDLPLSRHHRVESLLQQRQLPRPSHEGTARPRAVADDSRPLVGDPPDTVHGHRRMRRADRDLPLWLDPHVLLHQVLRRRTEQRRAWRRELPQPQRHLRGLACGRIEPLRVASEAVHHHTARVQAQTQGQGLRWRLAEVRSGRGHVRVQCERRQDRPLGVILLRHRRAKQRDEALTAEFDQAPGIAVQNLLDDGEHRLHVPMHRLGPQTPAQAPGHPPGHRRAPSPVCIPQRATAGETPQRGHGALLTPWAGRPAAGALTASHRRRPRDALSGHRRRRPVLRGAVGLLLHRRDEAIATSARRRDILWRLGMVLQGAACRPNAAAQGIIGDELPGPQAREQLVAGDDTVALRHEIGEHIEDLRSQRDEFPSAPQFIALGVEAIVPKHIAHRRVSSPSLRCSIPPDQLPSGATSYEMQAPGV